MMASKRIYLDYNATTPCDPRVLEAMLPYFTERFGNAASRSHPHGWEAEAAVDKARDQIAQLLDANTKEIVFTSGATESNNLALKGVFDMYARKGNHIITVQTEHKAVIDACEHLKRLGAEITYLPVASDGIVDLTALEKAITDKTIMVSVMWANNETGAIQPMKAIGDICAKHDILFMSDATQAVGKIKTHPREMGVHLMAFSGHKFYGPKGVGALYVSAKDPRVKLIPQLHGGGHERGMRSGTLNVPGIVGLGAAAAISQAEMSAEMISLAQMRDRLETAIVSQVEEVVVNGGTENRMPNVTNLSFKHIVGERLMMTFNQEIAVSSGSACTSASTDPSHVLLALGMGEDAAHSSLRLSLGRFTTEEEIDAAIEAVVNGAKHLRANSPVWEMYQDGTIS